MVAIETTLALVSSVPGDYKPVIHQLLKHCYLLWNMADQRERERKQKEETLYHYKPKTVDITGEEEDGTAEETEQFFTNYDKDFTNDQKMEEDNESATTVPCNSVRSEINTRLEEFDQFTNTEMCLIKYLHTSLCLEETCSSQDSISPHFTAYKLANDIISSSNVSQLINETPAAFGGHIKSCHFILKNTSNVHTNKYICFLDPFNQCFLFQTLHYIS